MRLFAFRVIAIGVTGMLAWACSFGGNGKDDNANTDDAGTDTDSGVNASGEGGSGGGGSGGGGGGGGAGGTDAGVTDAGALSCPLPVALSNIPKWNPSTQHRNACTANDMGILASYLTEPPSSWGGAIGKISSSCQTCVFSSIGDINWGVVVWNPNQAAGTGFLNVGGCYGVLIGTTGVSCAQGVHQFTYCEDLACPSACTSQSSCRSTVQSGACGSSLSSAQSACGSNYSNFAGSCSEQNPASLVNALCGTGGAG